MNRIPLLSPESATPEQLAGLDQIKKSWGKTPNITRAMAHAPSVVEGFLAGGDALSKSSLDAKFREQVAICVAQWNHCEYCLSAHTFVAAKHGVSEADRVAARRAKASDPKVQAGLEFVVELLETRGHVSNEAIAAAYGAGLGEQQIMELVGVAVHNILTNYVNHVAQTEIDWPLVPLEELAHA